MYDTWERLQGTPSPHPSMKKHYQVGGKGGYIPLPKSQEENRMELSAMSKVSHLSSECPYNPDARYLLRNTFCTPPAVERSPGPPPPAAKRMPISFTAAAHAAADRSRYARSSVRPYSGPGTCSALLNDGSIEPAQLLTLSTAVHPI